MPTVTPVVILLSILNQSVKNSRILRSSELPSCIAEHCLFAKRVKGSIRWNDKV